MASQVLSDAVFPVGVVDHVMEAMNMSAHEHTNVLLVDLVGDASLVKQTYQHV